MLFMATASLQSQEYVIFEQAYLDLVQYTSNQNAWE